MSRADELRERVDAETKRGTYDHPGLRVPLGDVRDLLAVLDAAERMLRDFGSTCNGCSDGLSICDCEEAAYGALRAAVARFNREKGAE